MTGTALEAHVVVWRRRASVLVGPVVRHPLREAAHRGVVHTAERVVVLYLPVAKVAHDARLHAPHNAETLRGAPVQAAHARSCVGAQLRRSNSSSSKAGHAEGGTDPVVAEVDRHNDFVDVADAFVAPGADALQLARARPALHLAVVVAARLLAHLGDEVARHKQHPRPPQLRLLAPARVAVLHGAAASRSARQKRAVTDVVAVRVLRTCSSAMCILMMGSASQPPGSQVERWWRATSTCQSGCVATSVSSYAPPVTSPYMSRCAAVSILHTRTL